MSTTMAFTSPVHGGLTDLVEDDEICEILLGADSPQEAAQALVDEANERGGVDNSTVMIVHVQEPSSS